MQNIRSTGTKPERAIMHALRQRKIYFAPHVKSLPGKPDIVFRRKRTAIFIDSDFWHGHPRRFTMPKTNRKYWRAKIKGNKTRDKRVNRELRKQDWKVLRFWEYDIDHHIDKVIRKIISALEGKRLTV
ncbi:MAG: very short patch repair endonuclease [Ignavibacteriales bacterium]|nr:very short patch repair endonuclease [Ignavibacteriales bacterium]